MVYVVGICGFIGGFAIGQWILMALLKNRSTEELLTNKYLKMQYGIMNWLVAAAGAAAAVQMYRLYLAGY